jgi:hypothetical protein
VSATLTAGCRRRVTTTPDGAPSVEGEDSSLTRWALEVVSLPSRGTLVLCSHSHHGRTDGTGRSIEDTEERGDGAAAGGGRGGRRIILDEEGGGSEGGSSEGGGSGGGDDSVAKRSSYERSPLVLRSPTVIEGDLHGTPLKLVYVPHGVGGVHYGQSGGGEDTAGWATDACAAARDSGANIQPPALGPRARRVAARRHELLRRQPRSTRLEGELGGGGATTEDAEEDAVTTLRRRSLTETTVTAAPVGERANDADGFSYRVTMNDLASAAVPVTIALMSGGDGGDDAAGSTQGGAVQVESSLPIALESAWFQPSNL